MSEEGAKEKPEYLGREKPVSREWGGRLPVALVFPERYEQAISTLGWQVVYRQLSHEPDIAVERFFYDDQTKEPLSHDFESRLSSFPLIGFSLNFELDLVRLVQMLDRAHIPLYSSRRQDWPLIMAGGPLCFLNPAPVTPGADALFIGESGPDFIHCVRRVKKAWLNRETKQTCLKNISALPGVFVPGISKTPVKRIFEYTEDNELSRPAFSCFISSRAEFRDSLLVEVNRGCPHGCRFCAAGYLYRPPRKSRLEDLKDVVRRTKPVKVGLVGTALTDWPHLLDYLQWLHKRRIAFSLSSIRGDKVNEELLTFLRKTGTRSLTFALEGVSGRLRRAMNKNLDVKALLENMALASRLQFNHVKLYCIVGWPDESEADFMEFEGFVQKLHEQCKAGKGKKQKGLGYLTFSVSCLVPKPWTPLQWAPMDTEKTLKTKLDRVRSIVKKWPGFRFSGEKPFWARLQGLISRGDESLYELAAASAGLKGNWRKGLKEWEGNPLYYLDRERDRQEIFPWECIDVGVNREFLWREWERYKKGLSSSPCKGTCKECNICGLGGFLERET